MYKAKLIEVKVATRIVVHDTDTEEKIKDYVYPFLLKAFLDNWRNNVKIYDDTEMPYVLGEPLNTQHKPAKRLIDYEKAYYGRYRIYADNDGELEIGITNDTLAIDAAFDENYDDNDNSGRYYQTRQEAIDVLLSKCKP